MPSAKVKEAVIVLQSVTVVGPTASPYTEPPSWHCPEAPLVSVSVIDLPATVLLHVGLRQKSSSMFGSSPYVIESGGAVSQNPQSAGSNPSQEYGSRTVVSTVPPVSPGYGGGSVTTTQSVSQVHSQSPQK